MIKLTHGLSPPSPPVVVPLPGEGGAATAVPGPAAGGLSEEMLTILQRKAATGEGGQQAQRAPRCLAGRFAGECFQGRLHAGSVMACHIMAWLPHDVYSCVIAKSFCHSGMRPPAHIRRLFTPCRSPHPRPAAHSAQPEAQP